MSDTELFDKLRAAETRFWGYVERRGDDECWPWRALTSGTGYGVFCYAPHKGKWIKRRAHRIAFLLSGRDLPEHMALHHTCRNRACVNPAHLVAIEAADHVRQHNATDGNWHASLTHCKRGHEYTPENTIYKKGGRRNCRTCHNASCSARYRRTRKVKRARVE